MILSPARRGLPLVLGTLRLLSYRFRNVPKIRLDTNQRKIHTPPLRGAVAASRLANTMENAKPTNSKARQWRAVMPVETGEIRVVADRLSPKSGPESSGKNHLSAMGCFAPIFRPFRAGC
jgi:hypothetical protein